MTDLLLQIFGLILLIGGIILAYMRWIRPRQAELDWQSSGLLLLVSLTLIGGFLGAPFWWFDEPRSFAWDVPALASRMLASAGWSFSVVCWFVLQAPSARRVRLILLLLLAYLAPLAIAIILFHLDRFDPQAPISYAFFIIVVVMVLSSSWYLIRQPRILLEDSPQSVAPMPIIRSWLSMVGIITALWGLALFITDAGGWGFIWVWQGDLLSSRLIGVMLLAIATGAFYSQADLDTARPMLAMIVCYGVGLAIASLWNLVINKPVPLSYLIVFAVMALISLYLLRRNPFSNTSLQTESRA